MDMEDRKEKKIGKKIGWKRFLAGVLVATLVLTVAPLQNEKASVAKAAEVVALPTENVLEVTVSDLQSFQQALTDYETDAATYTNGAIITLGGDLDFSTMEDVIIVPAGEIYIILNNNNIYGSSYLSFNYDAVGSSDYVTKMHFLGAGTVCASGNADVLEVTDWELYEGIQLTFSSDVDTSYTRFCVSQGASVQIAVADSTEIRDLTNNQYDYVFYNTNEGLFQYQMTGTMYVEELSSSLLTGTSFNLYGGITTSTLVEMVSTYVYSPSVIAAIPETVALVYHDEQYPNLYRTNGIQEDLRVDEDYGAYSLSDDGTCMTIYAMNRGEDSYKVFTDNTGASIGSLELFRNYTPTLDDESTVQCTKVIFAEGSILDSYTNGSTTADVSRILIYPYGYTGSGTYERNFIDFEFNLTNHASVNIYNQSGSAVSIIDEDTAETDNSNTLWVRWNAPYGDNFTCSDIEEGFDGENSAYYVKPGSVLTLTPSEGYTLYGIQVGEWIENSNDFGTCYTYDTGRNASLSNVEFCTDGNVNITIPNFAFNIAVSEGEMEAYVLSNDAENLSDYVSFDIDRLTFETLEDGTTVDWYAEAFTLSANVSEEYVTNDTGSVKEIYKILENESDWTTSVTVNQEAEAQEKTYYAIDLSYEKDVYDIDGDGNVEEEWPASTYGKITKLTYTYSMDLYSPTITGVTATDSEGTALTLPGAWHQTATAIEGEVVWINKVPVTLAVLSEDTDISEYAVVQGLDAIEPEWLNDSEFVFTDDGYYELQLMVRDEIDAMASRDVAGRWITAFGIDTTGPIVLYTDINSTDSSILVSDFEYEGNLYFTVEDEGSGVESITLYENADGTWTENAEALIATTKENEYYIVPTDTDATYRVVVTDALGNQTTYDNLVVKGYTQDIAITVDSQSALYGEDLSIVITIENTSAYPVAISKLELRAEATDAAFVPELGDATEVGAGGTHTVYVNLPAGTDAGTYDAVLDVAYTTMGGTKESEVSKAYSEAFSGTVEKTNGTGSITVENYYYGETFTYTVESATNETENVTLYFRADADTTAEFTTDIPTEVGTYLVKAVFPESANYLELTVADTFEITRMSASTDMYSISEAQTEDGWYAEDVVITAADGYTLSTSEDGVFADSLTISSSVETYHFYVKTESGAITSEVTLSDIKIDKIAPVVSYTDANVITSTELLGDSVYEGKLYLSVTETESGLASIKLYENTDGAWVENTEDFVSTNTGYYITATDTEKIYRIVAADLVGNEVTYDNLTLKAYAQDIQISVGETTAAYGSELVIDITIENISSYALQISTFALQEEGTDAVFDTNIGTLKELAAGETFTTTLKIPAGTNAGEYNAVLEIGYVSVGDREETTVEKECSYDITAAIVKSSGTATLTIKDFYYGETVAFDVISTTNDVGNAIFYYKDATDETAEFTTEVPSKEGSYQLKVVIPENDNYKEVVITESFKISRMNPTEEMYSISGVLNNGWYKEDVIITAVEGYTLSESEDGTFSDSLTIGSSVDTYSFYVKTESGAVTSEVILTNIKIDKNAPVVSYTDANIADSTELKGDSTYEGNLYLTIADAGSGVATVKLYEKSNDVWVENADALIATDTGYYVEPSETDKTYRIVVKDNAGNEAVYDNVTILADVVEKMAGTGTIHVKDFYYGEKISISATSDTNGSENVTLYYRDATDDTSEFTTTIPTEIGTYEVKAVFPETDLYKELVLTAEFEITRMNPATNMYVITEAAGKDGWYTENVVIKATEGYMICATENGNYVETLMINASTNVYSFYVKTPSGAVTSKVELSNIKVDKTAPEIGESEGIYAVESWWQKFLEIITFNLYEVESTQVEIKAHDNESGIAKISYYVSETAMSLDEVEALTNWTEGTQLTIQKDTYEQFVVYAKIENNAGLITYISTDGIQLGITEEEEESEETEDTEEEITTIHAGTMSLKKGSAYQLGEGTWNVSGDSTNYSGGITFYVNQDGDYNFTQN